MIKRVLIALLLVAGCVLVQAQSLRHVMRRAGVIANASQGGTTPDSVANLALWLDASDATAMVLDGSDVLAFLDKSTSGINFTNISPATLDTAPNGNTYAQFDGSTAYYTSQCANAEFTYLHSSDSTIFAVCNTPSNNSYAFLFDNTALGARRGMYLNMRNTTPGTLENTYISSIVIASPAYVSINYQTNSIAWDEYQVVTIASSPTNSVLADRSFITVNDNTFNENTRDVTASLLDPEFAMTLGAKAAVNSYKYNGKLCELIMYDRFLTDNEKLGIQNYLKNKWSISY